MDTLVTIILTAIISSFIAFIFTEFVSWKSSARREKIDKNKKLLEELYSPLITILNWMSIRTKNQLESEAISVSVKPKKGEHCFLVLHPHQYEKLWNIRSKYRYLFVDEQDVNLKMIDDIFLNLNLFRNKSGTKERWIYKSEHYEDTLIFKNTLIEYIDSKIIEICNKIKSLEKVSDNILRWILFYLTFWKV